MSALSTPQKPVESDHYGPQGRSAWLDVDWRQHQRWLQIADRAVNVIDWAPADPQGTVVFIHGLGGAWQNWLENIPHFAATHRTIAVDLPGFGASEMPEEKITISGYGRIVEALLDELEVAGPVTIVGNSMGGFVGAEVSIQFAERVDRLVLVSAAIISTQELRDDRVLSALRRAERILLFWGGWTASKSAAFASRPRLRRALLNLVAEHPEKLPAPLISEQIKASGTKGFVDALDALTDYPLRDRLDDIHCPTLIVWGSEDKLVPVKDAYELERLIPDSRVVVYADTGHVAMFERPADFNALVEDFLAE